MSKAPKRTREDDSTTVFHNGKKQYRLVDMDTAFNNDVVLHVPLSKLTPYVKHMVETVKSTSNLNSDSSSDSELDIELSRTHTVEPVVDNVQQYVDYKDILGERLEILLRYTDRISDVERTVMQTQVELDDSEDDDGNSLMDNIAYVLSKHTTLSASRNNMQSDMVAALDSAEISPADDSKASENSGMDTDTENQSDSEPECDTYDRVNEMVAQSYLTDLGKELLSEYLVEQENLIDYDSWKAFLNDRSDTSKMKTLQSLLDCARFNDDDIDETLVDQLWIGVAHPGTIVQNADDCVCETCEVCIARERRQYLEGQYDDCETGNSGTVCVETLPDDELECRLDKMMDDVQHYEDTRDNIDNLIMLHNSNLEIVHDQSVEAVDLDIVDPSMNNLGRWDTVDKYRFNTENRETVDDAQSTMVDRFAETERRVMEKMLNKPEQTVEELQLQMIQYEQHNTDLVCDPENFRRLVTEIAQQCYFTTAFEPEAYTVLQQVSEDYIVDMFRAANTNAIAHNSDIVNVADIKTYCSIRD